MFTGIVRAVGHIVQVVELAAGRRVTVQAPDIDWSQVPVGASVAVNGACMTVIATTPDGFTFEVSAESLACTVGLDRLGPVNLELAARFGDRIDGHLVSGHVDGTGVVIACAPRGESHELVIEAPRELARYLAYKGSVAVNGVSLTINRVEDLPAGCRFVVNLIPHTWAVTTLKELVPGARVNLEVDLIARYVERMLSLARGA
ncbi:MAG: riboflavin synthase [Burkholderiaceae bacterium]|nr:riboflavin synthase [Burkholderiaceae bacterium]MCX7901146.1 riboflavin synthase [Burkholderiaceae bacterium]